MIIENLLIDFLLLNEQFENRANLRHEHRLFRVVLREVLHCQRENFVKILDRKPLLSLFVLAEASEDEVPHDPGLVLVDSLVEFGQKLLHSYFYAFVEATHFLLKLGQIALVFPLLE